MISFQYYYNKLFIINIVSFSDLLVEDDNSDGDSFAGAYTRYKDESQVISKSQSISQRFQVVKESSI